MKIQRIFVVAAKGKANIVPGLPGLACASEKPHILPHPTRWECPLGHDEALSFLCSVGKNE